MPETRHNHRRGSDGETYRQDKRHTNSSTSAARTQGSSSRASKTPRNFATDTSNTRPQDIVGVGTTQAQDWASQGDGTDTYPEEGQNYSTSYEGSHHATGSGIYPNTLDDYVDGTYDNAQSYATSFPNTDDGGLESRLQGIGLDDNHYTTSANESQPNRTIRATNGESEKLDKSYKIRNTDYQKFFRVGRVFSTLWTESLGINKGRVDPTFISQVIYDEKVHTKVRRFVVVKAGNRSCSCLPVTSYDGWGHRKHGITIEDHGFIYSHRHPEKVTGMLPQSIKVVLSRGNAPLKEPSLVNYAKVYNVETNVKVKDIGTLAKESQEILLKYFRTTFFPGDDDTFGTPATDNNFLHMGTGIDDQQNMLYPSKYPPASDYVNGESEYDHQGTGTSYPAQSFASTFQGTQSYQPIPWQQTPGYTTNYELSSTGGSYGNSAGNSSQSYWGRGTADSADQTYDQTYDQRNEFQDPAIVEEDDITLPPVDEVLSQRQHHKKNRGGQGSRNSGRRR